MKMTVLTNLWSKNYFLEWFLFYCERKFDCIIIKNKDYYLDSTCSLFCECQVVLSTKDSSLFSLCERIEFAMNIDMVFLDSNLNLDKLAKICGANRTYAANAFLIMGSTFRQYLHSCRLNYAKKLIEDFSSPLHVEDIAIACGYKCSRTFVRALYSSIDANLNSLKKVYLR